MCRRLSPAYLAPLIQTSRAGTAQSGTGLMRELDAIAAVVIGGTSLMGGVGRIPGAIIGVLSLGIITSGFTSLPSTSSTSRWSRGPSSSPPSWRTGTGTAARQEADRRISGDEQEQQRTRHRPCRLVRRPRRTPAVLARSVNRARRRGLRRFSPRCGHRR